MLRTASELVPGNDQETGADGDGVLQESDSKIGDLERIYEASAPLIAGERSCNATGSAKDSPGRDR
jgi:hypothetical protein